MNTMQNLLINALIKVLIPIVQRMLAENYVLWGDKFFDLIEDMIEDSKTTIDDKFLPVIQQLRKLLNIPDLPDI